MPHWPTGSLRLLGPLKHRRIHELRDYLSGALRQRERFRACRDDGSVPGVFAFILNPTRKRSHNVDLPGPAMNAFAAIENDARKRLSAVTLAKIA